MVLFELGRQGFLDGNLDWDTHTFAAALLDLHTADAGVRQITGATNASPIVVTSTSHGLANGDLVYINGVAGNLAANGLWLIANVAANTFELQRPDAVNSTGSGAYTSGGYAVCIGPSGAGDNYDDFNGALVGTAQTLTSTTVANGVADAADVSYTDLTGATVEAIAIYRDTGTPSTSRMTALITGHHIVTVNTAPSGTYTTVLVEPLDAGIPTSTVLTFSNGQAVTLSGAAAAGDRALTVSSTSVALTAGSRALAPATSAGLPFTPSGSTLNVVWSNGANRIFKL